MCVWVVSTYIASWPTAAELTILRDEGELSASTLLYDISLLCTYSTHSFVLWTVKGIGRVFDIKLYHTIPLLWEHHTISYHAILSLHCGVGCRLVECSRELTLLWAHTSFPPSWVCVCACMCLPCLCIHVCVVCAQKHMNMRVYVCIICMCLCVCVTQPRPFSYFSSFLLRELHASLSFLPTPPPHENHQRYLSVI